MTRSLATARKADTCPARTVWPEVPPHGAVLACTLPAGHDGEHACADVAPIVGCEARR